ncbi:hypothetical protein VNO78_24735 [Psophocarpus tetragonolobus]|uniref:Uncharacterized protein n=1 Tax=Psophocarpus tetragonolobus TaxID=3891 RepID=A0AAN9XER1_PSOTE
MVKMSASPSKERWVIEHPTAPSQLHQHSSQNFASEQVLKILLPLSLTYSSMASSSLRDRFLTLIRLRRSLRV